MLNVNDSLNFGSIKTIQVSLKTLNSSIADLIVIATLKNAEKKFFSVNTAIFAEEHRLDERIIQSHANSVLIKIQKEFEIQKLQFFSLQLNDRPLEAEVKINVDNKKIIDIPIQAIDLSEMGLLEFAQIEFKKITNILTVLKNTLSHSDFLNIYLPKTRMTQQHTQQEFQEQSSEYEEHFEETAEIEEEANQDYQVLEIDEAYIRQKEIEFLNRVIPYENEFFNRTDFRFSTRTIMIKGLSNTFISFERTAHLAVELVRPQHSLCELGMCIVGEDGTEHLYVGSSLGRVQYGSLVSFPYCALINEDTDILVNGVSRPAPIRCLLMNINKFEQIREVVVFARNQDRPVQWGVDGLSFRIISDGPDLPVVFYPNRLINSLCLRIGTIRFFDNDWRYVPNVRQFNSYEQLFVE